MRVREVMTRPVVTASPETPFKELIATLVDRGVSGLPVVDDATRVVGIVTEADLIPKEAGPGRRRALGVVRDLLAGDPAHWVRQARATTAADVMTPEVRVCAPCDDVRVVAREMAERHVKRMPVVDGGRLVGIVSRHDVLAVFDRPDDKVVAEVTHTLHSDPNRPDDAHVEATIDDGVVVLHGDVRYPWDEAVVVSIARAVPGVLAVVSELHAREHPPPSSRGSWIFTPR